MARREPRAVRESARESAPELAPGLTIPLTDGSLPGLERATRPALLAAWLSEADGRAVWVVPRRLRYQPGVSLVMSIDVVDAGDPGSVRHCLLRTYAPRAAHRARKAVATTAPGQVLAYDEPRALLVTTAAGDHALPLLTKLREPDGLHVVADRLLPHRPDLADAELRLLRHSPERRWVALIEAAGRPALVLRAYRPREVRDRARCYAVLDGGSPRTPALLGRSRSDGVIAVEWVAGHELSTSPDREEWFSAGATLGQLHSRTRVALRRRSPHDAAETVWRTANLAARLLPRRAAEITDLGHDVARRLRRLDPDLTPVHGDFSADQVIVARDGRTALVDLDGAHLGDPAADLGCAVADAMIRAEEAGDAWSGRVLCSSMRQGYAAAHRPPPTTAVAVHALAFRIRKAVEPFRACRPDWPARVASRLDRAQAERERLVGGGWA